MAKTRAGIHYGDTFAAVCRTLGVTGSSLDKQKIIAPNTATKLNRRYKGAGVEGSTKERILMHLSAQAKNNADRAARLEEQGLEIANCILPAQFRITDAGCARAMGLALRPGGVLARDGITLHQVGLFAKGHFGVRKHIEAVARQIAALNGHGVPVQDLIEESTSDENECYPCAYFKAAPARQLELLRPAR